MKEKEKSKFNPFIKELRPDEEILWMSAPLVISLDLKRAVLEILIGAPLAGLWIFLFDVLIEGITTTSGVLAILFG